MGRASSQSREQSRAEQFTHNTMLQKQGPCVLFCFIALLAEFTRNTMVQKQGLVSCSTSLLSWQKLSCTCPQSACRCGHSMPQVTATVQAAPPLPTLLQKISFLFGPQWRWVTVEIGDGDGLLFQMQGGQDELLFQMWNKKIPQQACSPSAEGEGGGAIQNIQASRPGLWSSKEVKHRTSPPGSLSSMVSKRRTRQATTPGLCPSWGESNIEQNEPPCHACGLPGGGVKHRAKRATTQGL